MNYLYNDFDMFAMLEYDRTKTKGTSSNIQNTWLAQRYMQNVGMSSIGNQQLFEGRVGFNYSPSDEHIFGAYYQASHKPIKVELEYESQSWIDKLLDETSNVDKKMDSKVTEHLVDGYYNGMFNKWSLQATFDILWKGTSSDELSREHLGNSNHRTVTIDDNTYDVLVCNHVLEHVEDFRAALKEVKRILRKDGKLICSFPMDPSVEVVDEDPGITTNEDRTETEIDFLDTDI